LFADPIGFHHDTNFLANCVGCVEPASDTADPSICARSRCLQRDTDHGTAFDRRRSNGHVGAAVRYPWRHKL